jgi:hypothetical protein
MTCGISAKRSNTKKTKNQLFSLFSCTHQIFLLPLQPQTKTSTIMSKVSLRFYKDYKVRAVWDKDIEGAMAATKAAIGK